MSLYLENYNLSYCELASSSVCSQYGLRHLKEGSSHWLHYVIAAIEFIPVLGPCASIVEWICFKIFKENATVKNLPILSTDEIKFNANQPNKVSDRGYFVENGFYSVVKNMAK